MIQETRPGWGWFAVRTHPERPTTGSPRQDWAMPILPAEPDFYPGDLWEGDGPASSPDRRWWCLHTKPRQEKAAARDLRTRRVAYFLPQVVHEDRTPQGRKTRSIIPLFTSYLFLLGDDRDRIEALKGNRLVNVLEVADQAAIAHDLHQIHQML